MKVKCAFFDFDNTIANGDTIHKLQFYVLKKHPLSIFRYFIVLIYGILYVLHLVSIEKVKSKMLFALDILNDKELEDFYNSKVIPSYYPHMVEEIKKRKEEGCIVFLVTASSEAYMKYNDLDVDVLMGTQTEIINNQYTSKIIGKNCKDKHKVTRINEYLKAHNYEIDYDHSYGYSDSNHDIPMLSLVKTRYRVALKTGALSPFK